MPNPSLQLHYRVFITTTIWSAANISDHPLSDCFLLRFYSTMLTSLVPYDSLCTVLANLTPVIMYPEIRSSDTFITSLEKHDPFASTNVTACF
ncbi:MAG: hypothetical protein IPJ51_01950 [Saprospiraceae bacterium]|nr:hypothetical protein [Saprospiraceae bacterium]